MKTHTSDFTSTRSKTCLTDLNKEIDRASMLDETHLERVPVELLTDSRDRIEELEALLNEAADDIAQAAHDEHPYRDEYPDQMRRYNRDMDLPRRIRAALQLQESEHD